MVLSELLLCSGSSRGANEADQRGSRGNRTGNAFHQQYGYIILVEFWIYQ